MTRGVLIAAGGTGGHIVPAIAVAEKIRELSPETPVIFCGVGKEIERKLIPGAGFELHEIDFPPFRGQGILGMARFTFSIPRALFQAVRLLRTKKIGVVAGFGGYPSFAPMVAALLLGIPRILHEQNNRVGLANQLLSRIATKVFSVTGASGFRVPHTELPLPVRRSFRAIPAQLALAPLKLLVLGGSQGAVAVSSAVIDALSLLREHRVRVVHQCGGKDLERVQAAYRDYPEAEARAFIDDVAKEMIDASLIISRAGAMAVAEITAAGRPAIYIPLPIAGGHQRENCARAVAAGAGIVLEQNADLVENLRKLLRELFQRPERLEEMSVRALELGRSAGDESELLIAQAILQAGRH